MLPLTLRVRWKENAFSECRMQNGDGKIRKIRNDTLPFYKVNNAGRDDSSRRIFYALVLY